MLITVLSFLGVLVVIVLAHELGHFFTAKASGVRVEEFGLGFPPRLLSIKRGETKYSLNAIPLGGFVKLAGEEDPKVLRSLASKSVGIRMLVLGSGSLMNLLLPLFLFSIAFMIPHQVISGEVLVKDVAPDSPANRAGIVSGDVLLEVDGNSVQSVSDIHRYVQLNMGREVPLLVKHTDSTVEEVQVIPRWRPPEGEGAIGVTIKTSNPAIVSQHYPFWQAIPMGVGECIETFTLFKNGIISMIIGTMPVAITGPVGIAQMTGEVARAGVSPLLEFAAFLSINLAIINILPLPALDGGRIVFVLLEWIRRGRRISARTEGLVHSIGFAMLMAFFVAITYQDIIRIISGESLIP